ncbi:putative inactive receptor kinase [Sesamum angolense]|uniref:Inactive receptor kinase n=1 Tax=Sesamum angolense TaxID=2727404 RepID=A0AAE2BX31_9LAMI|nr:putative inactive receptor kinase [Sesamum angolense]
MNESEQCHIFPVGEKGPSPSPSLPHLRSLNWSEELPVCRNWTGISCSEDGSRVVSVRLPGVGFQGPIPENTLSRLSALQILSLRSNGINGTFPLDFGNLKNLTSLYLQYNNFSGPLPLDFSVWRKLSVVNLSNNGFNGHIPSSFSSLNQLTALNLAENSLSGEIPDLHLPNLQLLNLSGNNLVGSVPRSLQRFPKSVFMGERRSTGSSGNLRKGICHREGDIAEPSVGKGTFGTAYKAILGWDDGGGEEVEGCERWEERFRATNGCNWRIKHENVTELRAYYYSKDEKLMVYDYYSQGSLALMLHGKRGENIIPLDWETRLKIAIGAARGIARVHAENNGKLVHGNVKSSNVFLNPHQFGCVSDPGLSAVMSALALPIARAAGYRAPEVTDTRKSTQSSDVYSFGVIILELLTGKCPIHMTNGDEVVHLVRWVHSVVREEWTAEVFDVELLRYPNIEEELVEMLQIGMSCVVRMPDQRPKMSEVVKMVENVRPSLSKNPAYSDAKSENSTPMPPSPGV